MDKTVERILHCRAIVEGEINRPLTVEEQNIVRIAFLNGQNTVYDDMVREEHEDNVAEAERRFAKVEAIQELVANRPVLTIDYCDEEVTISMDDGIEIVHWVQDEWNENPTLILTIANAIIMARVQPEQLIKLHQVHIDSQLAKRD